jgi:hypothetical protein
MKTDTGGVCFGAAQKVHFRGVGGHIEWIGGTQRQEACYLTLLEIVQDSLGLKFCQLVRATFDWCGGLLRYLLLLNEHIYTPIYSLFNCCQRFSVNASIH